MALILLIDTSGETGIVALSAGGQVIAQQPLPEARRQAAILQPVIAEVMAAAGKELKHLEAVSVVSGPGSYTGLRVGLATAKGLCFALGIPLLMPDRLQLLSLSGPDARAEKPVWVLLPARAGEWFAGCYSSTTRLESPRHWEEALLQRTILDSGAKEAYMPSSVLEREVPEFFKAVGISLTIVELGVESFAKESERRYVNGCVENLPFSIHFT